MSTLERLLTAVPGGGRVYYSARWARRLAAVWRSPNRQFLAFAPGHYGSPLPDAGELARDGPRLFAPAGPDLPGIDLNPAGQLALADDLAAFLPDQPFPDKPAPGTRYHYDNEFYPYPDGVVLYAMLRRFAPRRVIEVGSGFSSAVMLDTSDRFLGGGTRFTFVEPYPDRLLGLLTPADRERTTILRQRVQDVPVSAFDELAAGDLLFIDSSHVGKIGSDVNHLFLDVLPRLKPGVLVHVHDIFWPFEYPKEWVAKGYAWNEAYLLRALLQFSGGFEVLLFPSYLEAHHAARWAERLPLAQKRPTHAPTLGGATIWLRRR
jgi:predicted O-methyltransferase YrrM